MKVITNHPLAADSEDHKNPRGAMQDNTHCPKFVEACKRLFGMPRVLDLGCAGGGLVADFLAVDCLAVGIEGSDYPLRQNLGHWPELAGQNLFCADITKPFSLVAKARSGDSADFPGMSFDVVTLWDVLEHLREEDLPGLFVNIRKHLRKDGLLTASVATFRDGEWHVTVKNADWWGRQFLKHNFLLTDPLRFFKPDEFPRGSANPLATGDWSGEEHGFHVVAMV